MFVLGFFGGWVLFFGGPVRLLLNLLLVGINSMVIAKMTNKIIKDYINSRAEVRTLLVFRCG